MVIVLVPPVDCVMPEAYAGSLGTGSPRRRIGSSAPRRGTSENDRSMAHYTRFPPTSRRHPTDVFALWTNLDRIGEWIGGVTGVSDVSGPIDQVGTTYVVHFGPLKSPTEILEVERPRRFATKFGSWVLRGRSSATFEPDGDGTRITQEFETVGRIFGDLLVDLLARLV